MIPRWYHRNVACGTILGRRATRIQFNEAYLSRLTDAQLRNVVSNFSERLQKCKKGVCDCSDMLSMSVYIVLDYAPFPYSVVFC